MLNSYVEDVVVVVDDDDDRIFLKWYDEIVCQYSSVCTIRRPK